MPEHRLCFKAAECSLHLRIAGKLFGFGLSETFKNRGQVRRINFFRFATSFGQPQHRARNLILTFG